MNARFKVFASYNILQYQCDFIHVLIFVTASKCRKSPKLTNIVISHEYAFADRSSWFVFQATLAPPATGQMFKGLLLCYSVVISTFFSAAASGYWAFGNGSAGNIFTNLAPYIPNWLVFLGNMFVIIQLVAISLVSPHKMIDLYVISCVCVSASIQIVLINSKMNL